MDNIDKALNPSNLMGESKPLPEMYVQGLSKQIALSL